MYYERLHKISTQFFGQQFTLVYARSVSTSVSRVIGKELTTYVNRARTNFFSALTKKKRERERERGTCLPLLSSFGGNVVGVKYAYLKIS